MNPNTPTSAAPTDPHLHHPTPHTKIPSIALALHDILLSCNAPNYSPRVIEQLLEVMHKYTTDIVEDAKIYQRHTRAAQMEPFHLNLAVQSYMNHRVTSAPNVDSLLDLAKECNEKSAYLMPSEGEAGVLLPPERYCLSKMNYQMQEKSKKQRRE